MPASRTAGSSTFNIDNRAVISTPSASAVNVSIGFFFAFIIFGREAYRGSFKRKSTVITAGIFTFIVSSPPSISRVTIALSAESEIADANVA